MNRIITDDDLHASLPLRTVMRFAGSLEHQPGFNNSASVAETEGGSSSGVSSAPRPSAGAAACIGVPANAEGKGG